MIALKECIEDINAVDTHRREYCRFYNECLGKAARKSLKSFSCKNCAKYEKSTDYFKEICWVKSTKHEYIYPSSLDKYTDMPKTFKLKLTRGLNKLIQERLDKFSTRK